MIAILQFDAVNLRVFQSMLDERRLASTASLRARGQWHALVTPAPELEGSTYHSLHSGVLPNHHGLYFPFMWSPSEQRVKPESHFSHPEPVWDRIARAGRRSFVVDPYESRRPNSAQGVVGLSGWQFRHPVTLHAWSVPRGTDRLFRRRFGRPKFLGEVYGRPSGTQLARLRDRVLEAPERVADVVTYALARESFDLVWVTMVSAHIAGHWFLDLGKLAAAGVDRRRLDLFRMALVESYTAVEVALARILAVLPADADIVLLSASGMGPNTSRSHLLPAMLRAVLTSDAPAAGQKSGGSGALWRLRAMLPTDLRAWVARVLPDDLTLALTARLELRGMDWRNTRAFMPASGDCGYVRLNLRGRERDGIVEPADAEALLEEIARGLKTFRRPDGEPVVHSVDRISASVGAEVAHPLFPDLIIRWSTKDSSPIDPLSSPSYGEIPTAGWGSGRTGEHTGEAWAVLVPGRARLLAPSRVPHLVDIAATICSVLGVDSAGLDGQPLLAPPTSA